MRAVRTPARRGAECGAVREGDRPFISEKRRALLAVARDIPDTAAKVTLPPGRDSLRAIVAIYERDRKNGVCRGIGMSKPGERVVERSPATVEPALLKQPQVALLQRALALPTAFLGPGYLAAYVL